MKNNEEIDGEQCVHNLTGKRVAGLEAFLGVMGCGE